MIAPNSAGVPCAGGVGRLRCLSEASSAAHGGGTRYPEATGGGKTMELKLEALEQVLADGLTREERLQALIEFIEILMKAA